MILYVELAPMVVYRKVFRRKKLRTYDQPFSALTRVSGVLRIVGGNPQDAFSRLRIDNSIIRSPSNNSAVEIPVRTTGAPPVTAIFFNFDEQRRSIDNRERRPDCLLLGPGKESGIQLVQRRRKIPFRAVRQLPAVGDIAMAFAGSLHE